VGTAAGAGRGHVDRVDHDETAHVFEPVEVTSTWKKHPWICIEIGSPTRGRSAWTVDGEIDNQSIPDCTAIWWPTDEAVEIGRQRDRGAELV